MADNVIDGFSFSDAMDVSLVEEEILRIKYLSEKVDMNNPEMVLAVYDKLLSSGIFVTPVGLEYLRNLQSYLYKNSQIPDEAVRNIPIAISYNDAIGKRNKAREEKLKKDKRVFRKTFKHEYKISLIANIILVFLVVVMFVITIKADNPNMINYRSSILNEYSEWQTELTERENEIKARERELGIKHETKSETLHNVENDADIADADTQEPTE